MDRHYKPEQIVLIEGFKPTRETEKAWILYFDKLGRSVVLPKSQILAGDPARNSQLQVPRWLAIDKGICPSRPSRAELARELSPRAYAERRLLELDAQAEGRSLGLDAQMEAMEELRADFDLPERPLTQAYTKAIDAAHDPIVETPVSRPGHEQTTEENTMSETNTNTQPTKPKTELADILADAGKIAAGATVLSIITRAVNEAARKAGVPALAVDHPVFQGIVKLAAPSVLRAVAQRLPHLQDVGSIDQILRIAQVSAVASVAQETIEAVFDAVAPTFKAIGQQAVKAQQLAGE